MNYIEISRRLGFLFFVLWFIVGGFGCEKAKTMSDKPLPENAFKAEISLKNPPTLLKAGDTSKVVVRVRNTGKSLWRALGQPDGKFKIDLGDHWLDRSGKILINDADRASLPYDIKPGEEVSLEIELKAPPTPGDYILEYDMVQETVNWFKDRGSKTAQAHVKVE